MHFNLILRDGRKHAQNETNEKINSRSTQQQQVFVASWSLFHLHVSRSVIWEPRYIQVISDNTKAANWLGLSHSLLAVLSQTIGYPFPFVLIYGQLTERPGWLLNWKWKMSTFICFVMNLIRNHLNVNFLANIELIKFLEPRTAFQEDF